MALRGPVETKLNGETRLRARGQSKKQVLRDRASALDHSQLPQVGAGVVGCAVLISMQLPALMTRLAQAAAAASSRGRRWPRVIDG